MSQRLHYIDWLRVFAFAMLIIYHSAVGFFPNDFWLISSLHASATLELVMDHPRAWRLPLLFFVSGVGTYFAYKSLNDIVFLSGRGFRLVVPLLFAMAVICVPQVWYEQMLYDGYEGGLFEFWLKRYFTEGKYPSGHFTWAHMWFIGYLFTISILFFPIQKFLDSAQGQYVSQAFCRIATTRWVYLLFLVPFLLNLALSPWFPRATFTLYNDFAWLAVYISWFAFGYLYAIHHAAINEHLIKSFSETIGITVIGSVLMYQLFWLDVYGLELGNFHNQTSVYKFGAMGLSWVMILCLTAMAYRFFNIKNNFITYANQSIFTLYIVHQTIIVGLLYHTIQWGLGFVESGLIILIGTFILSLAFYHVIVRHLGFAKICFGFLPPQLKAIDEVYPISLLPKNFDMSLIRGQSDRR